MSRAVEIKALVAQDEDAKREFQRTLDLARVSRAVAAMLNTGGGTVVVGVTDEKAIEGIAQAASAEQRLKQHLASELSPPALFSVRRVPVAPRREALVIDVPTGSEGPYVYQGSIYLREDGVTVRANAAALSKLIQDHGERRGRWERQPALGVEIDDLDLDEVEKTSVLAKRRRLVSLGDEPEQILDSLHLWIDGRLTNGAVVLFAKEPVRWFPQTRVRAVRFQDTSADSAEDNRVFEGHIFELLESLERFLGRHLTIEAQLPLSGYPRGERPSMPSNALREALLNALCHRDYAAYSGGLRLGIWDDRVELWNSGGLPEGISPSDLKTSHASRPRNPDLANVLFLRGLVEGWGKGTTRMVEQVVLLGLPEPDWSEVSGGTQLVLQVRPSTPGTELLSRERRFLQSIDLGEVVRSSDYGIAVAGEVTPRQARTDLKRMVRAGFFKRVGQGRATRYVRTAKPLPS